MTKTIILGCNRRFFRVTALTLVFSMLIAGGVPKEGLAYVVGLDEGVRVSILNDGRGADLAKVRAALESRLVSERLRAVGLTDAEVKSRMEKLDDAELRQFASQIDALYPGGDIITVVGVLLILTLVVLLGLKATGRKIVIK